MIDSARIRRELEGLLADQTQAVRDLAQSVADRASAAIAAGQPPSEVIARAVEGYDQALQDRISRDVTKAVCMGAGIWPEVATTDFVDQFAAQALVMSWGASQMPLSTRIHGTSVAMRAELDSAIRASISRRDGAWKQARRIYDGYGFGGIIHQDQLPGLPKDLDALVQASRATLTPEGLADLQARAKVLKKYAASLRTAPLRAAYTQLLGNLEKGLSRGLANAIKTAAEEKARYHAERISRTETARAWGQGFMDQLDRDEDATGLRWETSSAHKIFDICDFHARADLYGMGPGIYPKERCPRFPAHPHCLCVLSAVYKGKPRFDQVDKGGKAALDAMKPSERARLLTIQGAEGFDRGGGWKGSLRQWEKPGLPKQSQGAKSVLSAAKKAKKPQAAGLTSGVVVDMEAAVVAQERSIWQNNFETGIILKEGQAVITRKGAARSVSFDFNDVVQMHGAVVTHNHPGGWDVPEDDEYRAGNSFSSADLSLASRGMVRQMRAVTPKWVYILEPEGRFKGKSEIAAEFALARSFVDRDFVGPMRKSDYFHTVNGIVAEKFNWKYSREEHGFDRP